MAIVVVHKATGRHYILIGTGYSFYKDSRPSFLGGVLFPHEDEGEAMCAAICDEKGTISWAQTSELEVIEVNGVKVREILSSYINDVDSINKDNLEEENCPACGTRAAIINKHCPGCGIKLAD